MQEKFKMLSKLGYETRVIAFISKMEFNEHSFSSHTENQLKIVVKDTACRLVKSLFFFIEYMTDFKHVQSFDSTES